MDEKTIARFWAKVDKNGPVPAHAPHLGPCWVWTGAKNHSGHGVGWNGKRTRLAHRLSWELTTGSAPPDCACHKCDNPPCCNPSHLFLGSRADNLADMRAKGRQAPMPRPCRKGELAPVVKLSESQVRQILSLRASGSSCKDLSAQFHVTTSNIYALVTGRSWKHIQR
jgi:hypothetical protein